MMETSCLSDNEFIDVENDSDSEQIQQNGLHKTDFPVGKFVSGKKTIDFKNSNEPNKAKQTLITSFYRNKNTSDSNHTKKKDELRNVLFGVVNKLFSARVVLNRIPNPEVTKIEKPTIKPVTRNENEKTYVLTKAFTKHKNTKIVGIKATAFINEGTAYVRICPKCRKLPVKRKTQHCHSCEVDLTYECLKCHNQFRNYKMVLAHLDSKCFIRGYYLCSECDYKTMTPARVKSHMVRLHPSVKYNKKTLQWTDAKEVLEHKCSQCGKQFDSHEFLNKHVPMCNKAQELIESKPAEQIRINKDFQKMIVRFCSKCETDTSVYEGGVSSLLPCAKCGSAMKFKCSQCGKQYPIYTSIQYHTKICGDAPKPKKLHPRYIAKNTFNCPHCKKPFVQRIWLKKHLPHCKVLLRRSREPVIHKHLKSFCNNCDEAQNIPDRRKICAKCKSSLHFRCKTCDKSFSGDCDTWCTHLKTYFDRVKYVCNDCGMGLTSKRMMWKHLKICNRENLHCDLCDFTTKFRCSIYRHILFRHPVLE